MTHHVHASHAGYKVGGVNTDRIAVTVDMVFEPETAESYELGMKANFRSRPGSMLHCTKNRHRRLQNTISFRAPAL
jgi:hypothetical protein